MTTIFKTMKAAYHKAFELENETGRNHSVVFRSDGKFAVIGANSDNSKIYDQLSLFPEC